MTKTPISLQDLRRSLYVKAKAEPTWRFWGLYVHVCKMETLHSTGTGRNGDETTQPDPEVDWEERSPARRSGFTFAQQSLSQRGRQNAGEGDSHHAARKIYPCAIRAVCG